MSTETTAGQESSAQTGARTPYWLWILPLCAGLLGVWLWFAQPRQAQHEPLPVMYTLPDFALVNGAGEQVTLADLRGTVWIADFMFTRCGGQCLTMTGRMRDLQTALEADTNVKLVSISVDPEYDTPEVLTNYAQRNKALERKWLFLTGEREAVYALATGGFKLGAAEATDEQIERGSDRILHSVKFVLVDGHGRIRRYYNSTDSAALHKLLADARSLARGPAA